MCADRAVHVSIVSHGHGELVRQLLSDIEAHCAQTPLVVTLTLNVPEVHGVDPDTYSFPVRILENPAPQGFGTNHNAAFQYGQHDGCDFFCVLNPDVRLYGDVFAGLLKALAEVPDAGVAAPRVVAPDGGVEDSARRFPHPWTPVRRALFGVRRRDALTESQRFCPDWVAGMFMLFRSGVFRSLGGFDPRYFLYYEDVDICARVWLSGNRVVVDPSVSIVHAARRDSHRKLRYFVWHARGIVRFFASPTYWRVVLRGRRRRC